ncbi:MAG: hypothetical protein U1E73_11680 [Planctomycetota bacterium]
MDSPADPRPRPRARQALAIGAGFAVLFALLARDTLHPPDAPRFIAMVHSGDATEHHHFGYIAVARLVAAALRPFGMSTFQAMRALSALSGGLAVAIAHRAFVRADLGTARAAGAALLVGCCPSLLYYATTVEIHAVHLAASALVFWSAAGMRSTLRGPATTAAALGALRTGVLSGLAATVHASGHLLPGVLAVACMHGSARGSALRIAAMGTGHALASAGIVALLVPDALAAQSGYFAGFLREPIAPAVVAATLWREWLVALAPVAWLGLLAGWRSGDRSTARWLHLAFVPYLGATVAILRGIHDYGSYLLPLVIPLAWLAARIAPPRLVPPLAALGLLIGWCSLPSTAGLAAQREFSRALAALELEVPVHVLGLRDEIDAVARWTPGIPADNLLALHGLRRQPATFATVLTAAFDERMAACLASGRAPLLTAGGAAWLRAVPGDLLWQLATEHIERRYRLEAVDRDGLHGWLVRPRAGR